MPSVQSYFRIALLSAGLGLALACANRDQDQTDHNERREQYRWAFAQDIDGTFNPNEFCRESLAQSVYTPANQAYTIREGRSNVFLFTGLVETYRIYAFSTQTECETALTSMVQRARIMAP
jgi:F0F1-type ATP synthase membrane subunit c/vacuolar-type H+-ATPase subunit K